MATHSHAGHMPTSGKALIVSAWLTGIYFVIELAVGLWTGSARQENFRTNQADRDCPPFSP